MHAGQAILDVIHAEFARRQAKNARYSMRSFAKQLSVDASALRQILAGKRTLSFNVAAKILTSLRLTEATRNALLLSLVDPSAFAPPSAFRQFTDDELRQIAGWEAYAILCALELDRPPSDERALAATLGVPLATIRATVAALPSLGLLRRGPQGLCVTGEKLTTAPQAKNPYRVQAHREYIERAVAALEAERDAADFSGITMAIAKEKVLEAMRRIREFRRSLSSYLCSDVKDAVYRVNIQLFPLEAAASPAKPPRKLAAP